MASKKQILADQRVKEISDERENGDGIWVYLKKGFWNFELETHCIHEQTIGGAYEALKSSVEACDCEQCKK